jgi:hypothetical protein
VLREIFGLMKEDAAGVGIECGFLTTYKLGQIILILIPFNVCVYLQKFLESEVIGKYHPYWKLAWASHV